MKYQEYCEAYKEAQHQYACHNQQVSGVWSISGKEFCEKYHLNYDDARAYELECLSGELYDFYTHEENILRCKIGELTKEQERTLWKYCNNNYDWDEEGVYFWEYVKIRLLADAYPEYNEKYQNEEDHVV